MSRLSITTPNKAQLTVERLYKDLERRIVASPPGLCPVDLQLSFLKLCQDRSWTASESAGGCAGGAGQLKDIGSDQGDCGGYHELRGLCHRI